MRERWLKKLNCLKVKSINLSKILSATAPSPTYNIQPKTKTPPNKFLNSFFKSLGKDY